MTVHRRQNGVLAAVSGTGSLYAFLYFIFLSRVLTDMPLTGGSLYMCGRVTALYMNRFVGDRISRGWRIAGTAVLTAVLAVNLMALMFLAPQTEQHDLWLLFAIVLTMTLRDILGRRMLHTGRRSILRERLAMLRYAADQKITTGAIFITRNGKPMSRTNIWREMKNLCEQAGVNPQKVFPHNLRHLFARTFYGIEKDIAKLADILGHSSINATRIYIITTGNEHRQRMENMRLKI